MNQLHWTPNAKVARDEAIGDNHEIARAFQAAEQTLRETYLPTGMRTFDVRFTKYRLVIEVDFDREIKITTIEILNVTE